MLCQAGQTMLMLGALWEICCHLEADAYLRHIERALHAASYRMACWPLPMVQTYADAHL